MWKLVLTLVTAKVTRSDYATLHFTYEATIGSGEFPSRPHQTSHLCPSNTTVYGEDGSGMEASHSSQHHGMTVNQATKLLGKLRDKGSDTSSA
jgi:hypothetical protein